MDWLPPNKAPTNRWHRRHLNTKQLLTITDTSLPSCQICSLFCKVFTPPAVAGTEDYVQCFFLFFFLSFSKCERDSCSAWRQMELMRWKHFFTPDGWIMNYNVWFLVIFLLSGCDFTVRGTSWSESWRRWFDWHHHCTLNSKGLFVSSCLKQLWCYRCSFVPIFSISCVNIALALTTSLSNVQ